MYDKNVLKRRGEGLDFQAFGQLQYQSFIKQRRKDAVTPH